MCECNYDTITIVTTTKDDSFKIQVRGKQTAEWKKYSIPLPVGTYHIIFEYTMGMAYFSDMGLDHVAIDSCKEQSPVLSGKSHSVFNLYLMTNID